MIYFGDRLNSVGLRLVGLKKGFSSDTASIRSDILKYSEEDDIFLVSNKLFQEAEDKIEELRGRGKIIISIPDESGGGEEIIEGLIRRAVGFDLRKK